MDILSEVRQVSTVLQAVHFAKRLAKFADIPAKTALESVREKRGIEVSSEEYRKYSTYVPTFTVNTRAESRDIRQDSSGHLPRFDRIMAR
jgi:hypothetical protein